MRAALLLALLGAPGRSLAQVAEAPAPDSATRGEQRIRVDDSTTVQGVRFTISGDAGIRASTLRAAMATQGPGFDRRLRATFSWIPGVQRPLPVPFDPVTLQMDVVRLRRLLQESGYPAGRVDYRVEHDEEKNRVLITMMVDPGPPRLLEHLALDVTTADPDVAAAARTLEESLRREWTGRPVGNDELGQIQDRTLAWAQERGHAFPRASVELVEGSDPFAAAAVVHVEPGPVTVAHRIVVEGEPRLSGEVIRRHLAIRPGDTITTRSLDRGQRMLEALDLVGAAFVGISPGPRSGTADLQVRVREANPRVVAGRAGYADDHGILAEGRLEHRDFLGGARVMRIAASATTGIGSLADFARRNFGGSVSVIQPHVFEPEIRLISTLYGYRDDGQRELAEEVGGEMTLLYAPDPDRFLSVGYSLSTREVLESRGVGGVSLDIFELLELKESLERRITQTMLTLSGSWGRRDDVANPTRGWLLGGSVDLSGGDPWSTNQFLRAEVTGSGLHPFLGGRLQVLARARVGRLWPFGRSRDQGDNPAEAYLRLGDAVFTAGGTGTVRGWQAGLLGPKFPGLEVDADAETLLPAGRWIPLGGLSRWVASIELQTPLGGPGGGPYALVFADAGRVWTHDPFFVSEEDLPLRIDDGAFAGIGVGLGIPTLVGPIRVMVGYKLNPGSLDLRDSDQILEEFLTGSGDLEAVPRNAWSRWRLHFAIGQPF